jgi:hypothetical protein
MPLIDVNQGLTGPVPWIPSLPMGARLAVLLGAVGASIAAAAIAHRRTRDQR